MPRFHAEIAPALTHAFAELRDARHTNPAWFPFVDRDALAPLALEEPERELVRRALVAPVVAALGVTISGTQEELRIALDADGAVLLTRDGAGPHEWMYVPADSVATLLPDLVAALLPEGSRLSAPPRMTARGEHTALRLTAAQRAQIAERLQSGTPAREAIAAQDDLPAPLRDALLTDGERATFEITMHVPALESSPDDHDGPTTIDDTPSLRFHLLRRWTAGELALYATDEDEGGGGVIHQVEDGDVLGTVLPLLAEGGNLVHGEGIVA